MGTGYHGNQEIIEYLAKNSPHAGQNSRTCGKDQHMKLLPLTLYRLYYKMLGTDLF